MLFSDNLDAWNNISGLNSTQPYKVPTSIDEMSFVDSSGYSSGFNTTPIAQGAQLGGSIFSGFGYYQQGKQAMNAANYNADLALLGSDIQMDELDSQATILSSRQRAGYLKAGVALSGSPLDVMMESAKNVEMDKQMVKINAQSKADMFRYEGEVAKNQARFKAGQSFAQGGLSLLLGI